jgi:hypothetical protein
MQVSRDGRYYIHAFREGPIDGRALGKAILNALAEMKVLLSNDLNSCDGSAGRGMYTGKCGVLYALYCSDQTKWGGYIRVSPIDMRGPPTVLGGDMIIPVILGDYAGLRLFYD